MTRTLALAAAGILAAGTAAAASLDAGAALPTAVDSGSADAGPPAGMLSWSLTAADGGALDLDGGVPTDAELAVHVEPRLVDFRLRLLDASGRLVPATENIRLGAHTDVALRPDPALQPGSAYQLVLEPDASETLRDAQGHAYASADLRFRTAGEPPSRKSKPGKSSHKRRRHR